LWPLRASEVTMNTSLVLCRTSALTCSSGSTTGPLVADWMVDKTLIKVTKPSSSRKTSLVHASCNMILWTSANTFERGHGEHIVVRRCKRTSILDRTSSAHLNDSTEFLMSSMITSRAKSSGARSSSRAWVKPTAGEGERGDTSNRARRGLRKVLNMVKAENRTALDVIYASRR